MKNNLFTDKAVGSFYPPLFIGITLRLILNPPLGGGLFQRYRFKQMNYLLSKSVIALGAKGNSIEQFADSGSAHLPGFNQGDSC